MKNMNIFKPGESLILYVAPNPLRIYFWLRQFPSTCVCFLIFLSGMAAMHFLQSGYQVPPDEPEIELGFFPMISKPFIFSKFDPANEDEMAVVEYVRRFEKTARSEAEKYGQPASVALAQAINESNSGRSELTLRAKNHFGVKCFSRNCKAGHCVNFSDDSHKDFFMKYESDWHSWRAHSKHVGKSGRYAECHKSRTLADWCDCLQKKGYATNPNYSKNLKSLIEKYHLKDFDR